MNEIQMRLFRIAAVAVLCALAACDGIENPTNEEEVVLDCADGENPDGNGCRIPCEDGRHVGPDGACIADCPSRMEEDTDGSCVFACEGDAGVEELNIPLDTDTLTIDYCAVECPEGMVEEEGVCVLPCGEGRHLDADGNCRLDCPEGTVETEDGAGCAFETVGENKKCPDGTWDTSIEGPGPLFVDHELGSEDGDGSQEAPFATIRQAVLAMGDRATIYLAAGVYYEQVVADGEVNGVKEFNLIGHCASDTVIDARPLIFAAEFYPSENGMSAGTITTWWVDKLRIHGVTVRSRTNVGIAVRHEYLSEATEKEDIPETVEVDQCRVESAILSGVSIRGGFRTASVSDCSLTGANEGLRFKMEDEELAADEVVSDSSVVIERNRIHDLISYPEKEWNALGVFINVAGSVRMVGNEISDFDSAVGFFGAYVHTLEAEGNIFRNLEGFGAISLQGENAPDRTSEVTIQDNLLYNISAGACIGSSACPNLAYGIFFNTLIADSPLNALLNRNRIERVQGHSVFVHFDRSPGNQLSVLDSDFVAVSNGIDWRSGTLTVKESRFDRAWRALHSSSNSAYEPLGSLIMENNLFEDREEDPAGMPESTLRNGMSTRFITASLSEEGEEIRVRGNVFRNNPSFDSDDGLLTVLYIHAETVTVDKNVFENNDGVAVDVRRGNLVATGNLFRNNLAGVWTTQFADTHRISAEIRNNHFGSNLASVLLSWEEDTAAYSVEDNVFLNSNVIFGRFESGGSSASEVSVSNNYFGRTYVQSGNVDELRIWDNYFEGSRLVLAGQPKMTVVGAAERTAEVTANLLRHSKMDVFQWDGALRIAKNDLSGPLDGLYTRPGTGISVIESPGPVQILHNIIRDYPVSTADLTAGIGDGIHVVGTEEGGASDVWIESNVIEGCGRYGVLMVNAEGRVEGNQYQQNGSGLADDFVVALPSGDGVSGIDSAFSTTAEEPPHTLEPEDISSVLW